MKQSEKIIGEWIAFYRQAKRQTHTQMAAYLRCTVAQVQAFEATGVIPAEMLWKVSLFFALPLGAFYLGFKDEEAEFLEILHNTEKRHYCLLTFRLLDKIEQIRGEQYNPFA